MLCAGSNGLSVQKQPSWNNPKLPVHVACWSCQLEALGLQPDSACITAIATRVSHAYCSTSGLYASQLVGFRCTLACACCTVCSGLVSGIGSGWLVLTSLTVSAFTFETLLRFVAGTATGDWTTKTISPSANTAIRCRLIRCYSCLLPLDTARVRYISHFPPLGYARYLSTN